MYSNGNMLTTSLCSTPITYSDMFTEVQTDCFGGGGWFRMRRTSTAMVMVTQNSHTSNIDFFVSGQLGSENQNNPKSVYEFTKGRYKGYVTSACSASSPSVNHLFIIDSMASPDVVHTAGGIGTDDDSIQGIAPGSMLIYVLYSNRAGVCQTHDEHHELFETTVDRMILSDGTLELTHRIPELHIDGVCRFCNFG